MIMYYDLFQFRYTTELKMSRFVVAVPILSKEFEARISDNSLQVKQYFKCSTRGKDMSANIMMKVD